MNRLRARHGRHQRRTLRRCLTAAGPPWEKPMKEFTFRAPTLYDASATASEAEKDAWHDAPGAADYGAKTKKFALWLKSEMVKMGLAANGPYADEGNWMIDVPADGGGFSLCIISGSVGDDLLFNVLVSEIG